MGILIRVLILLGLLCFAMNLIGITVSYYSTVSRLANDSADLDAVDELVARTDSANRSGWSTVGWNVAGCAFIISGVTLAYVRIKRRRRRSGVKSDDKENAA